MIGVTLFVSQLGQVRNHPCFAGTSHFDGAEPPGELMVDASPDIGAVGQAPLEETIIADLASLGWGEPIRIREKVCTDAWPPLITPQHLFRHLFSPLSLERRLTTRILIFFLYLF
jgi:hypothetical protein